MEAAHERTEDIISVTGHSVNDIKQLVQGRKKWSSQNEKKYQYLIKEKTTTNYSFENTA